MPVNLRRSLIRRNQNDLLYAGIKVSAIGSAVSGAVVAFVIGPVAGQVGVWTWFALLMLVYGLRSVDLLAYRRARSRDDEHILSGKWRVRFTIGALASALAWCSSLWMIFPTGEPFYESLLIFALAGVAGGALGTLPYDRKLSHVFQSLILASVLIRLWSDAGPHTFELSSAAVFVFGFLITCGREVGKQYHDLLSLRYDSQETSVTLMRAAEEMAGIGYWQWAIGDPDIELSGKLAEMLELGGRRASLGECYRIVHPNDRARVRQAITRAVTLGDEMAIEYRARPRGRKTFLDMKQVVKTEIDSRGRTLLLGTLQDVSDVKQAEKDLYRMAYHDELTGLETRARFHEHLDHHTRMARASGASFSLIVIDLDDFKSVNKDFGHERGDEYLRAVAGLISGAVRKSDHVARIGGDEFALLLHGHDEAVALEGTVARLRRLSSDVLTVGGQTIRARFSAGIARYAEDVVSGDGMMSRAAAALEHAKEHERGTSALYSPEMEASRLARARLESDLRQALAHEQFELVYQPKISLESDRMTGVEALIRWHHPKRGMVSPGEFIEAAERIGMIADIGDWVLESACRQQSAWRASGHDFVVSLNISGQHFTRAGFVDDVVAALERHGLAAGQIEIEITESVSRDPEEHNRVCGALRRAGVLIAIDDFGTGYSSLSVLGDLAIDTIKIDRSFVTGVPDRLASRLKIDAIVAMCVGLGYHVIAEGVETRKELDYLRSVGCTTIQGFYFSQPVGAEAVPALVPRSWVEAMACAA